jgi:uncharacterized membrane protein (DUF485 family)
MKARSFRALKIRFIVFFSLLVIAVFTFILLTSLSQVNTATEIICENLGIPIARRAAAFIDGDAFARRSGFLALGRGGRRQRI